MNNLTLKPDSKKSKMKTRFTQTTTAARPVAPATRTGERPSEKPIEFSLKMPHARSACVAGSFNQWDPRRTPMQKDKSGGWKATVWLPPGRYEYRFCVDDQWLSDPNARECVANGFGSENSVVTV
jgi:1,4-alpha-glucan branching enzyme